MKLSDFGGGDGCIHAGNTNRASIFMNFINFNKAGELGALCIDNWALPHVYVPIPH